MIGEACRSLGTYMRALCEEEARLHSHISGGRREYRMGSLYGGPLQEVKRPENQRGSTLCVHPWAKLCYLEEQGELEVEAVDFTPINEKNLEACSMVDEVQRYI